LVRYHQDRFEKYISSRFGVSDVNGTNVGYHGKRLVAVDYGLGRLARVEV
jgi:hypothetical protein